MNWISMSLGNVATLLGASALLLTTLHFLKVRRQRRVVPTLLFHEVTARSVRARRVFGGFRHWGTWLLLLVACACLSAALGRPEADAPARAVVLDAGALSQEHLPELIAGAKRHGALRPETVLLIAQGDGCAVFPPGDNLAARRAALADLTSGPGLDALLPVVQRAAALVRWDGTAEVVLLSPRECAAPDSGIRVLREGPALNPAVLKQQAPVLDNAPVALSTAPELPPLLQALASAPSFVSAEDGRAEVRLLAGATVATEATREPAPLHASSVSGILTELHDAELPFVAASVAALEVREGDRVLLSSGEAAMVLLRSAKPSEIHVAPALFAEGSAAANDATLMALLCEWIHAAARTPQAEGTVVAGERVALRADSALITLRPEGAGVSATYAQPLSMAVIAPTQAGALKIDGHEHLSLRVAWPELARTEAATVAEEAAAALNFRQLLLLLAAVLLVLEAVLYARGRIP